MEMIEFNSSEIIDNNDFNARNLRHAFNNCFRIIAQNFLMDFTTEEDYDEDEFMQFLEGAATFVIYDTRLPRCAYDSESSIEHWNKLKEQGVSKLHVRYFTEKPPYRRD